MKKLNCKSISILMLILVIMSLFITGCSKTEDTTDLVKSDEQKTANSETSNKDEKFEDESYIVSQDWLKENLEDEDTLILDARSDKDYNRGHIPGAVSVT